MHVTLESVFTQARELCDDLVLGVETRRKLTRLAIYAAISGALYGLTMGLQHSYLQAAASAIKVPVLFLCTLAICLPSLHFLGLLFGSIIRFEQSVCVLVAGICRTSILLGAFAPVSLFFLISGSDYSSLLLIHVVVFAFCGGMGLFTIYRDFERVRAGMNEEAERLVSDHLLKVWMVLYMIVGTQMAYNLAPFVNRAGEPISLVQMHKGNFYSVVWHLVAQVVQKQTPAKNGSDHSP